MFLHNKNPKILASTCQLMTKKNIRRQQTEASLAGSEKSAQNEWQQARPLEEIPKPNTFRLIRNHLPGGKYHKKNFIHVLDLMRQEYGNVIYFPSLFGKAPMVLTFNTDDLESLSRNEGVWPNRPGSDTLDYYRNKYRADFFDGVEGLISTQGEKWGKFRSIVNPVLMQPKNVRLYLPKLSQVSREFIQRVNKIRDPQTNEMPANFEEELNRWALESIAIAALDKRLGILEADRIDPQVQKFFQNLTEFFYLSSELETKPSLWKFLPTPKLNKLMKVMDNLLEITLHFINETIERLEKEKEAGMERSENEKSVLEKLLKLDKKVATVMAMDMLLAGVDTTTSAFTAIMLSLAKFPEKQAKLREEIRQILPRKDSELTEKSLNEVPYLRACIKEGLRFHSVTNGNARVIQRDIVISGYRVPKGTPVVGITTTAIKDENHFSHPNEFMPERWLRISKDSEECPYATKSSNPFVFLPFGFGSRSCIGRRIAEMELEVGIARFIRNYYVAFNYPTDNAFKTLLFNVPNIPLKFQLTNVES